MMSTADLEKLAEDIRENGLRDPIWLFEGKIIDGRNRYLACKLAGVEPRFREGDGKGSLVAFVLSVNLHRRHLTDQQRALVAVRVKAEFETEALERRDANLLQNKGSTEGPNLALREEGRSADRASALLRVTVGATKKAANVIKNGIPELVSAVEKGAVSLDAAVLVAGLPEGEQREVVEQGKVKEKARDLRAAKSKAQKSRTSTKANQATSEERPAEARDTDQEDDGTTADHPTSSDSAKPDHAAAEDGQPGRPEAERPRETTTGTISTKPTTSNPETKQPVVTFKAAFRVVLDHLRDDRPLAKKAIEKIAYHAALTMWMPSPDPRENLSELERLLIENLESLADKDYEEAERWWQGHVETGAGVLERAAPEGEDGEGCESDGDGSQGDRSEAEDSIAPRPRRTKLSPFG
jgi:ParB-like chromosome segregation protein Spo0J